MTDEEMTLLLRKAAISGALKYASVLLHILNERYIDIPNMGNTDIYKEGMRAGLGDAINEIYSIRKIDETDKFSLWLKTVTIGSFRND